VNLGEAFRHYKTIGASGQGTDVLDLLSMTNAPGVVTSGNGDTGFAKSLVTAIGWHRHWNRLTESYLGNR
jgi:catalase